MKITVFVLMIMFISCTAFAECFVIFKSDTKEVYTIAEKRDTVIPAGYDEDIILTDMKDLNLQYHPTMYDYKNEKLVANMNRISDAENLKTEKEEAKLEMQDIDNKIKWMAKKELEKEGKKFKRIKDKDFE